MSKLTTEDTENTEGATPETDKNCGWALTSHYGRSEGRYLSTDKNGPFVHAAFARKLERERDEARGLARHLYWAGCDLRRFATAYAQNYNETDGKEGAFQAIADFHEAMKGMARILGEEDTK